MNALRDPVESAIAGSSWEATRPLAPTVLAFSKYLAYVVGGAEKSTFALLEQRAALGQRVVVASARDARFLGTAVASRPLPAGWTTRWLEGFRQWSHWGFSEYAMNRGALQAWFARADAGELWTYGMWSPAAAIAYPGPVTYFIRSESDLGIAANYHEGFERWAKRAYLLAEQPALALYRRDLAAALRRATTVVANSRFIAGRVKTLFGVDAEVRYPDVSVDALRAPLAAAGTAPSHVVFVGDNVYKGLPIVLELARRMPDVRFRIVSRFVPGPREERNVQWMPWTADVWRVFDGARAVIVPSQWEEAYGRIARKAVLLGLPVLASEVGGLPESVDHDPARLVTDYRSAQAWQSRLRALLEETA